MQHSSFRAPRQLPHLETLLADLAGRADLARYLGISPRTLTRWRATGAAPRAIMLALFWESRYGVSMIECDAHNAACASAALAASLERECTRLRGLLDRMQRAGAWDSANAPLFDVR